MFFAFAAVPIFVCWFNRGYCRHLQEPFAWKYDKITALYGLIMDTHKQDSLAFAYELDRDMRLTCTPPYEMHHRHRRHHHPQFLCELNPRFFNTWFKNQKLSVNFSKCAFIFQIFDHHWNWIPVMIFHPLQLPTAYPFQGQFVKLREGIQSLWINTPQPRLFQGWFSGCHQGASTSFAFVVVSLLSISSLESTLIPATLGLGVECVKGKWEIFLVGDKQDIRERKRERERLMMMMMVIFMKFIFCFDWMNVVEVFQVIRGFGVFEGSLLVVCHICQASQLFQCRSCSTGWPLSREWGDESPS